MQGEGGAEERAGKPLPWDGGLVDGLPTLPSSCGDRKQASSGKTTSPRALDREQCGGRGSAESTDTQARPQLPVTSGRQVGARARAGGRPLGSHPRGLGPQSQRSPTSGFDLLCLRK